MRLPPAWMPAIAVLLVIGLGYGIDRADPSQATTAVEPVSAGAAVSGAWYCAAGDTVEGGSDLKVIAAAPPREDEVAADVIIDSFRDRTTARGSDVKVNPSSSARREIPAGLSDVGIASRWWDSPAAVTRTVFMSTPGGPEGYIEGPCEPQPSPVWVVPGLATAGGAQAELVLANPFDSDASVAVTFTTPEGLIEPKLLENVVVPKRSVRKVVVNEHAPQRSDLGAVVRTRSGRIVTEGVQVLNAAIGGVNGRSLVKAAAEPAETWTIPWFAVDGDEVQSWLWVTNIADRPAALTLTFHGQAGGSVADTGEDLDLAPGETRRIDLNPLVPEGVSGGGVTVRSENSVPFVASGVTEFLGSDEARTGIAVQLGATAPADTWVLSGGATLGRDVRLHLANPGAVDAVVDVVVWSANGVVEPPALQGVRIPPGAWQSADLTAHLPEQADDHTVFVVAREGGVVASRTAEDRVGTRRFVAALGIPSTLWSGGQLVPGVGFSPSLTQRIGTSLGPQEAPIVEEPPVDAEPPAESETEDAVVEDVEPEPTEGTASEDTAPADG